MSHPVNGVDHVFLLVNDLEKSAEQYRRFGFTLSPRGLHSKEKGTGNYTIMFPDDYFELLGIVSETDGNLHQREKLAAQGEGLHAIACRIASASDAKKELTELGLKTGDVGAFSRPVELPAAVRVSPRSKRFLSLIAKCPGHGLHVPAQNARNGLAAGIDKTCEWREWACSNHCNLGPA